jgi:hypothetical protein
VTVSEAYDGRSAIEATVESSVTKSRYVDRRKERRKNYRRIEPVEHWRRCGSA